MELDRSKKFFWSSFVTQDKKFTTRKKIIFFSMLGDAIISHMSDIENGLIKIMNEISFNAAALSHYNFTLLLLLN